MDRPIIFSAPMVRALLDGRKTQTRRVLRLPSTIRGRPIYEHPAVGGWEPTTFGGSGCFRVNRRGERDAVAEQPAIWHRTCGLTVAMPYTPGDRLWVREAWSHTAQGVWSVRDVPVARGARRVVYRATERGDPGAKWFPSIHMPRWASRLTLHVTAVRVQRLQDISEEDARAEGVEDDGGPFSRTPPPKGAFAYLWDDIHGAGAWDANPWVAAFSFSVERGNIDALRPAA